MQRRKESERMTRREHAGTKWIKRLRGAYHRENAKPPRGTSNRSGTRKLEHRINDLTPGVDPRSESCQDLGLV